MILELIVLAVAVGGTGYLVGTTKGKADLAALKVAVAPLLTKVEASVVSAEATVKADVVAAVAKVKAALNL